jgi:single-stranded-DNA-specific exonuclease
VRAKTWRLRPHDADAVTRLGDELGLLDTTARVLAARGIGTSAQAEAFLNPTLDALHSPFSFVQMEAAVDRLLAAIEHGERIVVHGDYDVDGITGTVVLVVALRALGADIEYLVPHRVDDGYGLKPAGIDRARDMGARVVIAVDCGITALAAAERARRHGIDLIIADHHEPGQQLPEARAVLNPRLPDAGYPEDDLAAVGVAFKLARGVLQRHPRGFLGTALSKLVALGTVADLVPLTGENRVFTHHGLQTLGDAVNPGLRALMEFAGVRAPISASDIGFRLAPRINAVGRLGHPRDAVEMFLATEAGEARRFAKLLHDTNNRRREIEAEVLEQALQQRPADDAAVVVAAGVGWHRGVIGIVASRLVETWGRPAVVLAVEEDLAFGSARSIPGFNVVGALRGVAELLDEFGGHHQAAGLQMGSGRVEELRAALAGAGGKELDAAVERSAELLCDAEVELDDQALSLARELDRLAPFGVGNPRPRLLLRDMRVEAPPQVLKGQHLKLRLSSGDRPVDALAWRRAEEGAGIAAGDRIDVIAKLSVNTFRGRAEPQLELVDWCADGSVAVV